MEAVYNDEEKKQILKRFQKVSLEQLKDEKRKNRQNKLKKLEVYVKKFENEGRSQEALDMRMRIAELKELEEKEILQALSEGNEVQDISDGGKELDLSASKEISETSENKEEDNFTKTPTNQDDLEENQLINRLERRVSKEMSNEHDLQELVQNDSELAKELAEIEDLILLFDENDPLRKMENLQYSQKASYKNINERKKEFDIRFESFFRKKDGESIHFEKENEMFENISELGENLDEDIEKIKRAQGYVKLLHQKQIVEECVKTAQDPKYQQFVDTYIFTEDRYRVDCGIVFQRPPIFVK